MGKGHLCTPISSNKLLLHRMASRRLREVRRSDVRRRVAVFWVCMSWRRSLSTAGRVGAIPGVNGWPYHFPNHLKKMRRKTEALRTISRILIKHFSPRILRKCANSRCQIIEDTSITQQPSTRSPPDGKNTASLGRNKNMGNHSELVGAIPTPLKNMKVSPDDYSQYMEK